MCRLKYFSQLRLLGTSYVRRGEKGGEMKGGREEKEGGERGEVRRRYDERRGERRGEKGRRYERRGGDGHSFQCSSMFVS